jgi:linoleate 10R-lipoxygenase
MEKIIQFLSSLPSTSSMRVRITDGLITNLWDHLLHPPLSYVGDLHHYRTADGSYNVPPPPFILFDI